jgi:hypothetical protein
MNQVGSPWLSRSARRQRQAQPSQPLQRVFGHAVIVS